MLEATEDEEGAVKRRNPGPYAIALAILVVGFAFAGVPFQTMLFGLLVLACPLFRKATA
ncbi:hypothetical protein [Lentzea flava]|uniref:DUF4395 domain-containing protein n=1 Tax=Lentzea flava TaxID=103732 RepID=A0ABQ2UG83_9PSEU|nr:hypothetical protein [Lentzea flava]MCP2198594.1 hypothetical protein [Lentzea flava]GGU26945.1 hypothetical protein GCM10010178_19260 [Lentzea flava]